MKDQLAQFAKNMASLLPRGQVELVTDVLIHPDQTCAVPGRKITETLMFLRDTVTYVQDRGVDTCLISLNQEEAFDRILHTYMRDVLSKIGFEEGICNWIRLLYTNIVDGFLELSVVLAFREDVCLVMYTKERAAKCKVAALDLLLV
eukprot:g43230.t1